MKQVRTQIRISASAEKIYRVVVDSGKTSRRSRNFVSSYSAADVFVGVRRSDSHSILTVLIVRQSIEENAGASSVSVVAAGIGFLTSAHGVPAGNGCDQSPTTPQGSLRVSRMAQPARPNRHPMVQFPRSRF